MTVEGEVESMARRKTITREQILNAAFQVVATEGFAHFTARNIASKMNCSTQPIYLEFKNMEDLKLALFKKIGDYLEHEVFSIPQIGDPLIDTALNYIELAQNQKVLYRAIYMENHNEKDYLNKFSYELFEKNLEASGRFNQLTNQKKHELFTGIWIVATGLASLMSGGILTPERKEIVLLIEKAIDNILKDNNEMLETLLFEKEE